MNEKRDTWKGKGGAVEPQQSYNKAQQGRGHGEGWAQPGQAPEKLRAKERPAQGREDVGGGRDF